MSRTRYDLAAAIDNLRSAGGTAARIIDALDAYLDERERNATRAAAALTEDPWHEAWHEGPGGKAIRCTTAICAHPNHRRPPATDAEVRGHARPSPATVPIDITATVVTCSCETKWEDSKGIPERVIARQVSGCRLHGVCAAGHTLAAAGPPYVRCGVCGWQEARHGGSVYCQVHSCGDPAHYPSGGRPFVLCTCPSTRPISAGHEAACPCHPTTPHGEGEKKPHDAQPDEGSTARAKTPREVWVILNADGAPQEVYPTEAKARHEASDWYGTDQHAPVERYMVADPELIGVGVPLDDVEALLEMAGRYAKGRGQGTFLVETLAKHLRRAVHEPACTGHVTHGEYDPPCPVHEAPGQPRAAPTDVPAGPQRLAAAKARLDELHAEMTAVLLSIGPTESA